MRPTSLRTTGLTLFAAALAAAMFTPAGPAASAPADQTCPPGQVEDVRTPGFQCVPSCPSGTLLDGVTNSCVAVPGVPPPALP